jgi:hypothetical protein
MTLLATARDENCLSLTSEFLGTLLFGTQTMRPPAIAARFRDAVRYHEIEGQGAHSDYAPRRDANPRIALTIVNPHT